MNRVPTFVLVVLLGLPLVVPHVCAQDGLAATGRGRVSAKPDIGIARLVVRTQAESSADALKLLESNRKRVQEALSALDDKALTTDWSGVELSIGPAGGPKNPFEGVIVMGQSEESVEELEVFVSQVLTVTLRGTEKLSQRMGKVLDVAGETKALPDAPQQENPYGFFMGLQDKMESSNLLLEKLPAVRFECEGHAKHAALALKRAYEAAVEEARAMVALAGVNLGPPKEIKHERSPRWSTTAEAFDIVAEVKVRFSIL